MKTRSVLCLLIIILSANIKCREDEKEEFDLPQTNEEIEADFDMFDKNNDKKLDAHEIRSGIQTLDEDNISEFFETSDKNRDGVITFSEYAICLS